MTTPTQIRIDADVKKKATALFANLGLDMSSAVNLFLHQCLLQNGLPFHVGMPNYSKETMEAMEEAKKIARDPNVKGYHSMEELKVALGEE